VLPADVTARLHGPLKDNEIESIKQLSRMEIDRAFSGLSIAVTTHPNAFWRVEVLQSLPVRMSQKLPNAGESVALDFDSKHCHQRVPSNTACTRRRSRDSEAPLVMPRR